MGPKSSAVGTAEGPRAMPERYLPSAIHSSGALDGFQPASELTVSYALGGRGMDTHLGVCAGGLVVR